MKKYIFIVLILCLFVNVGWAEVKTRAEIREQIRYLVQDTSSLQSITT